MELDNFRKKIDEIDKKIIILISERIKKIKEISDYKKKNNVAVKHEKREKEIIENAEQIAIDLNITPKLVEKIMRILIDESCRIQKKDSGELK